MAHYTVKEIHVSNLENVEIGMFTCLFKSRIMGLLNDGDFDHLTVRREQSRSCVRRTAERIHLTAMF